MKLLKRLLYLVLVVVLLFGSWKVGNAIGWTYLQLQKAEKVNRQLNEVYLEQADIYYAISEYQESVEKEMKNMYDYMNAITMDMLDNKKQITETQKETQQKYKELFLSFNLEKKNIKDIIKERTDKPSYEKLKSMTVLVVNPDDNGKNVGSMGTGVIVKKEKYHTYILTNNHVCSANKEKDCFLLLENGIHVPLEPVKGTESNYDVSLLRTMQPLEEKTSVTSFTIAKPQERVFLVGHHLGRPYVYGEGVFAGYDETDEIIQIPTMYGNSGSGVFNAKGELIGLVYAGKGASPFQMDFAHAQIVPGSVIKMFLKDLFKGSE